MSEIPLEGPEISLDQVEALGALEKAFEEALSQVPLPYVLSQVMAMFPKVMSTKVIGNSTGRPASTDACRR